MSANNWHGCSNELMALITGTVAYWAKVSMSFWLWVRIMMMSTISDSTRARSSKGSPRPIWVSPGLRKMVLAPICAKPASKATRVRVLLMFKISAPVLPTSGW